LVSELGSSRYHGGLLDPLSGGLNPAEMVNGLLATAVESGVTVIEDAEVLGVDRRDGRISVETARGAVAAGEIVAAANGYTPSWLTWLRRRIIPIGSYIVVTEPLGEGLASELIPRDRMVFDTKKFLVYFRLTPDNRLLFGGRTSFWGHDDGTAAKVLTSWMRGVFPQLGATAVDYAWSGSVAFTFDQMPRVGRREGVAFSGGVLRPRRGERSLPGGGTGASDDGKSGCTVYGPGASDRTVLPEARVVPADRRRVLPAGGLASEQGRRISGAGF